MTYSDPLLTSEVVPGTGSGDGEDPAVRDTGRSWQCPEVLMSSSHRPPLSLQL